MDFVTRIFVTRLVVDLVARVFVDFVNFIANFIASIIFVAFQIVVDFVARTSVGFIARINFVAGICVDFATFIAAIIFIVSIISVDFAYLSLSCIAQISVLFTPMSLVGLRVAVSIKIPGV
ncbi:hypothetical protein B0J14DRAFT_607294 [Halenospora varia]|nr:hypothetical protein B0J14DRAFT_607294 [Halenospora varia]